jgi:hypothetical protein
LFATLFIVCGKVNFTNLSRYGDYSERTYRRQYQKSFNFISFDHSPPAYWVVQSISSLPASPQNPMVAHQNLSITDPPTNLEPPPVTGIQRVMVIGLGISETFTMH